MIMVSFIWIFVICNRVSKAHIQVVDHVLKKRHVLNCCDMYRKNGDFNPTHHDWLGEHKI